MPPSPNNNKTKINKPEKRAENIRNAGIKLKKDYEYFEKINKSYGTAKAFIDFLQELEESFFGKKGGIWNEREAGEKIAKRRVEYLKSTVKENAGALDMVYNDFKGLFQLDRNPYEDTEKLLANYRGCEVCERFIIYLRSVFLLLVDLKGEKITLDKAKDKIRLLEIDELSGKGNIEKADLERIYIEFKTLIEGR
jgi:hypothetical protein